MPNYLEPRNIRVDCGTQSRVQINEDTVDDYAEAMARGEQFPPVLAFCNEKTGEVVLADGFHRYYAHMKVRPNDPIACELRMGTVRDAKWASIGANKGHGLRRTNADKRNAVRLALLDSYSAEMSTRAIASYVGAGKTFVQTVRREMERLGEIEPHDTPAEKVKRALADPANAEKTNRQIAQECGVAHGTVNRIAGQSGHGGQIIHPDTEQPASPCCGDCENYMRSQCILDGKPRQPGTEACEHFEKAAPTTPEPEPIPRPDPESVKTCEPPEKTGRQHVHQYRRLKGCLKLHLPPNNPQLFAVELRQYFPRPYLESCFAALKQLWLDDTEDPHPDHIRGE